MTSSCPRIPRRVLYGYEGNPVQDTDSALWVSPQVAGSGLSINSAQELNVSGGAIVRMQLALESILTEMRIMNLHLAVITGEEFIEGDAK